MLDKMYFFQYYAEGEACNAGLVSLKYESLGNVAFLSNSYITHDFSDSPQWTQQKSTQSVPKHGSIPF
jgi:hypothetical protein